MDAQLNYKGIVASIGDLPKDAIIGDVYTVDESGYNYGFDGHNWQKIASYDLDVNDVWQVLTEMNIDKLLNISYDEYMFIASLPQSMTIEEVTAHLQAYRAHKQLMEKK